METKYYCMIGLPSSGKTTFLAAFTYMLLEQTEAVELHMNPGEKQEGLTDEFRKQIDKWTNFEPLDHTGVGQEHRMKYTLCDVENMRYILEVPDSSGETFDAILEDRYIEDDIKAEWNRAEEILFFLHLDRMDIGDKEELLTEMPKNIQEFLAQKEKSKGEKEESKNGKGKSKEKPPMLHGQFAVVELLQILCDVCEGQLKIKFILSAWDRIEKNIEKKGTLIPEDIFSDRMPFVYQFINSNRDSLLVQFWGVSAQGSDLTDEEEIEQMSYAVEPMERVKVVDPMGEVSYDLSKIFMV